MPALAAPQYPRRSGRNWCGIAGSVVVLLLAAVIVSCGALQNHVTNLCNCLPLEPDAVDYRHAAKHVPLPNVTPQEITVATILSWPQTPVLPPDAPRTGRELQLFHVANAFLQNASVNPGDCDVHLEISATADRNAPRVIVETPVDSEYCTAREQIQSQLQAHGFKLDLQNGGDLAQPLLCQVTGLAFEDFEHNRGTSHVATLWELHPAVVTINQ
ncbi:MAG TPA: hypothetical protein VE994_10660 [Terriglobales bacterium]|nr:hypothetical protein [Terriglobales bacterium]